MKKEHFKVTVGNHTFDFEESNTVSIDSIQKGDLCHHVLHEGKGFDVQIDSTDRNCKSQVIIVNGNKYEVVISSPLDQLLSTMGMTLNSSQQIKDIKAPMPGLILDIMVEVGQEIAKGDALLILEAMKMENVIKADGEGIIKKIEVKKGESVEKGFIIIVME